MRAGSLADLVTMARGTPLYGTAEARISGFEPLGKLRHLSEQTTAKASIWGSKLKHRVTRTRVNACRLPELGWLQRPPLDQESPGWPKTVAYGSPPVACGSSPGGAAFVFFEHKGQLCADCVPLTGLASDDLSQLGAPVSL